MVSLLSMLDRFEQAAVTSETSTDKADRDELHAARRAIMERVNALEASMIVAPAECSSECDDPHCPYSHQPLTVQVALENATFRMRAAEKREAELVKALSAVKTWAQQKCPCHNELPNPCPLCGASIENLEGCKAVDNTFPRILREQIDRSLRAALNPSLE